MTMKLLGQSLWLALVALTGTSLAESTKADDFGVFDWIKASPQGSFHQDQEYRFDSHGVAGMYATADIPQGTVLATVPWDLILTTPHANNYETQMHCELAETLAEELNKGESSSYAPLVRFAQSRTLDHVPSTWSSKGKQLLLDIIGGDAQKPKIPPVEPADWLDADWDNFCDGGDDPISEKAALLVVQWNRDDVVIPLEGFYNIRNGHFTNADFEITKYRHAVLRATRPIAKGEQIHLSWTNCNACEDRINKYGSGEMFRDFGIIEEYPQRWYDIETSALLDVYKDEETNELYIWWGITFPGGAKDFQIVLLIGSIRRQLRRLKMLRNIDYSQGNPGMPEKEWDLAWKFWEYHVRSMILAIKSLENGLETKSNWPNIRVAFDEVDPYSPHYDLFEDELDDINYHDWTCGTAEQKLLEFPGYKDLEVSNSQYQKLSFYTHPGTKDVVLQLDGTVQIMSIYRPQYHEYMIHSAARYLDSVKRIMFVGGGDSMLLHDALTYPNLELVVGLELDQMVVRKSFKYFHTQPHFDDPRVEWWFGDATKSLLLLWEEYWQSFDLVLVDLSETVMSFSVTKELDVFDALALLLKPDGIMVKNEQYLEEFSKVFDNSMEIYFICPVLCDQIFVMGSNGIDFLHAPMKDHGVDALLYDTKITNTSRMVDVHDYRRANAREQGKCGDLPSRDIGDRRAGILEVLEIEFTKSPVEALLGDSAPLVAAIKEVGFHVSAEPLSVEGQLFIAMEEGYVLVRSMGDSNHCSVDILVWGSFHELKTLSAAVASVFSGARVSRFRIVVGGMYGASTWNVDQNMIGPRIVETRDCSETDLKDTSSNPSAVDIVEKAVRESLSALSYDSNGVILVVCGEGEDCLARSVLSEQSQKLIELPTCPTLDPTNSTTMYNCEVQIATDLVNELAGARISIVAVDASAQLEVLQILDDILIRDFVREGILHDVHLMYAWSLGGVEQIQRRNYLDRYRRHHQEDPESRAQFQIVVGSQTAEFGVVTAGDDYGIHRVANLENQLTTFYKENENVKISLDTIQSGKYIYWDPFNPKEFLQTDYDQEPGLTQYFEQKALAHHIVTQMEGPPDKPFPFDAAALAGILQSTLDKLSMECTTTKQYDVIGDGMVLVCLSPAFGSVVLVWDGNRHVDMSYSRLESSKAALPSTLTSTFETAAGEGLSIILKDQMPRGTGRVVSLAEDIVSQRELDYMFGWAQEIPVKDKKDEL